MRPLNQWQFGFAPRLAALYAAIFVMGGIQLPFFPVWLKAKGLDPGMIGVVLAAPMTRAHGSLFRSPTRQPTRDALRGTILVASCPGAARLTRCSASPRRGGDPDRLCADRAGADAGDAALRDLRAKGLSARPRLWAGAAVGLGGASSSGTFIAGFATDTIPRAISFG